MEFLCLLLAMLAIVIFGNLWFQLVEWLLGLIKRLIFGRRSGDE